MARLLTGKKKRDWPVLALTIVALVLLGAELINVGWRIFKPAEQSVIDEEPERTLSGIGPALDLFGIAPESVMQTQEVAVVSNIKVYGTFAGNKKSKSYALLLIDDDKREVYGVGQEISPGTKITDIGTDYVTITGPQGEMKLPLIEEKTGTTSIGNIPPGGFAVQTPPPAPAEPASNATNKPGSATSGANAGNAEASKPAAPMPPAPTPMKSAEDSKSAAAATAAAAMGGNSVPTPAPSAPVVNKTAKDKPAFNDDEPFLEPYMYDNRG